MQDQLLDSWGVHWGCIETAKHDHLLGRWVVGWRYGSGDARQAELQAARSDDGLYLQIMGLGGMASFQPL